LTAPLDYPELVRALMACHVVLTDSGGLQEEAPSLGKPVLVMRDTTERTEGIEAGTARLVGTRSEDLLAAAAQLLDNPAAYDAMARVENPYGDGDASGRVVAACRAFLGC
jgi:UDP-N-acetylglucosamine 2-epimerase (non-hydrolysing)